DTYWFLIVDTSIHTLTQIVPIDVLVNGGILEFVDNIMGKCAHLFEPVAIAVMMCIVLLGERDEAREETQQEREVACGGPLAHDVFAHYIELQRQFVDHSTE
ncbi:hypothetical protein KI387_018744, partial [Taxus chinensis]